MRKQRLLRQLGHRVRTAREAAGYSREVLAERADIHTNTIGMIERGEINPSFLVLVAVARGLGMSTAELMRPVA